MTIRTLVSVAELHEHLGDPRWVIFDCRCSLTDTAAGRRAWETGHIPGAVHADMDTVLSGPAGEHTGRHPLPEPESLARWLGRHGAGDDSQVVAYDEGHGGMAARLWWLLRWLGHEAGAVLDGGLAAWQTAGLPLTQDAPAPAPATFTVRPAIAATVSAGELLESVPAGRDRLMDARAAERFRGETEPLDPVAGHVPGAVSVPFAGNVTPEGTFRTPLELRRRFEVALGGHDPGQAVHMCGSGVTACHNLLAMEIAGLRGSRLYPGSWSEWIRDPARPVATGDE